MHSFLHVTFVIAGLLLSACSAEELSESLFPEAVRKQLNLINDAIANCNYGAIRSVAATDASMSEEEFATKLDEVFAYLPRGTFVSRELAGFNSLWLKTIGGIEQTTYSASYQYEYTDGWAYIELKIISENGDMYLKTLNISRLTMSLRETNAFTLLGKRVIHYVILSLIIMIPIVIIITFVVCFRTRNLKRRKRWLAFIIFGVGNISLNWTTGATSIKILTVGVLGAGFDMASELSPVMLAVWFPLGAVLFWSFRQTGKLALVREQSLEDDHP